MGCQHVHSCTKHTLFLNFTIPVDINISLDSICMKMVNKKDAMSVKSLSAQIQSFSASS